jgi:hypothetical protein
MIDMTLLPEPWRSDFIAITAQAEGESFWPRVTLRMGDWLMRRNRYTEAAAAGGAHSFTCWPKPPHTYVVGRDVSVSQLYPDLWDGDLVWI